MLLVNSNEHTNNNFLDIFWELRWQNQIVVKAELNHMHPTLYQLGSHWLHFHYFLTYKLDHLDIIKNIVTIGDNLD